MSKNRTKIIIGAILVSVIFLPPFAKYQELRYKNQRLADRILELERQNKELAENKYRLETDVSYVEKKAREKIGVVRKGEIVLKKASKDK